MHRSKVPLLVLIASLLCIGPVLGRVTQVDPTDPYQISTPSAWERSQGLADDSPIVELEFQHPLQWGEMHTQYDPVVRLDNSVLLIGDLRVVSLDKSTLAVAWELGTPFAIELAHSRRIINGLTGEESQHILLSNQYSYALVDTTDGELLWSREKQVYGFSSDARKLGDGLLWHEMETEYSGVQYEILDAATGEILSSFVDYNYVYLDLTVEDVAVVELAYRILGFSRTTGEFLWEYPIDDNDSVRIRKNLIFILRDEELLALDPETGQEIWFAFVRPDYTDFLYLSPIVLLSYDNTMVSIDAETGLETHTFPGLRYRSLIGEHQVAAVSDTGDLVQVDIQTGEEGWRMPDFHDIYTFVWKDSIRVTQSEQGSYVILDYESGELLYSGEGKVLQDGEYWFFTIWFGDDNKGKIASFQEQGLKVIDLDTFTPIWEHTTVEPIEYAWVFGSYVAVTTPSEIIWYNKDSGEVVEQMDRPAEWVAVDPLGLLVIATVDDGVVMRDVSTGDEWTFADASVRDNIVWTSSGEYLRVYFDDDGIVWLYNLAENEMVAEVHYDEMAALREDGKTLMYNRNVGWVGDVTFLDSDGSVLWQVEVTEEVTDIRRSSEPGAAIVHLSSGILVLDESSGEEILRTNSLNKEYYQTNATTSPVLVAPGRVFEPGWEVSRVYRTADAGTEVLLEETILRGAPSNSAVERGVFESGTVVTRTGNERVSNGVKWVEVHIEGTPGWVRDSEIGIITTEVSSTPVPN